MSGSPRPVEGVRANGTLTDEALLDAIHMGDESWFWPVDSEAASVADVLLDLQQTRARLAAADRENAELRGEVERLRPMVEDTEGVILRKQEDVDDLSTQLAAAQAENADLHRDVASLTEQIAATDARVVELVGQVAEARAKLAEAHAEIERLRAVMHDWAGDMGSAAGRIEHLEDRSAQLDRVEWLIDHADAYTGPHIHVDSLRAALSAAPQPEPPASDEPARCAHGETDAHELWDDAWPMERKLAADAGCPGPAASGTPDEPPIPMHADCPHSETIPMLGSTDWIVCTACGTQISYWPDGGQR